MIENQRTILRRLVLTCVVVILGMVVLSSYYYKSVVLHPVGVWHGAQMSFLSLTSGEGSSKQIDLVYGKGEFERLKELKRLDLDKFKGVQISNQEDIRVADHKLQNQIAANRARDLQFINDTQKLKEVNKRLENSKKILEELNSDFTSFSAYQKSESERQQMIQEALDSENDVPSEADVKELLTQRGQSRSRTDSGIPEKVLNNVQQTTGISPEEINKLMNQ